MKFHHEEHPMVGSDFFVKTDAGRILMRCISCNAERRVLRSRNPKVSGHLDIPHLDWHDYVACGVIERTNYKPHSEVSIP